MSTNTTDAQHWAEFHKSAILNAADQLFTFTSSSDIAESLLSAHADFISKRDENGHCLYDPETLFVQGHNLSLVMSFLLQLEKSYEAYKHFVQLQKVEANG